MIVNIAAAVTAVLCLFNFNTLTDAYAGIAHWGYRPWCSASPDHHGGYHGVQESHPKANRPWYSNAHPSPSASSLPLCRTSNSSPTIVHTTNNGHSIDVTAVRIDPTPTINGMPAIKQEREKPWVTDNPNSVNIIPSYGNHTLFYTNRWRIDSTTTPFKQIHSPSGKTGVDMCLRACIKDLKCAFAGHTQLYGKLGTNFYLNKTCSLYTSEIGAEKLVATNVDEKRILGPDFLALIEDRVSKDTLTNFLKDKQWWDNKEAKDVEAKAILHGHNERAVEVDARETTTVTTMTTSVTVTLGATTTPSTSTSSSGSAPGLTESVQFDMRKRFFLRTRVISGKPDFDDFYIRNPSTGNQVNTPHLTSNRSAAALFSYSLSTSSINLCCSSSKSSLGLTMIRDRDGDAYGSAILAPQVGTARMAMILRNCVMEDGVGIVQISSRSSNDSDSEEDEDEDKDEEERARKEAYERLNHRYGRLHPNPPVRRYLHSVNNAVSTFFENSNKAVEPVCGTIASSASLVWKNDRFGSWVVCRRFDGESVDLRWWDVISDGAVDVEFCAKVDLEGVGVGEDEIEGRESC